MKGEPWMAAAAAAALIGTVGGIIATIHWLTRKPRN